MRCVYLIQSLENGYYKIGISKHPQKRIDELKTGNSSELKLIESYKSEFSSQIERALHRKYSHLRKEGEWFDLSINEEVLFILECQKIENNLIFLKKSGNAFV
jgi:predicted GIY-YIG superfamily endonuclease